MSAGPQDVSIIKKAGWRQGSALSAALAENLSRDRLLRWDSSPSDVLVVLSHDCDITNASLSAEPFVEILRLRPVSKRNGNLVWGKNPRRYQFTDPRASPPVIYEASVHDRAVIPRDRLLGHDPDITKALENETRSRLCRWVAARYTRAAFADAFNHRIESAVEELRPLFKANGHLLSGIYLLVVDDELAEREDYRLAIIATMLEEQYADPDCRASGQELLDRIEAIIGACPGVDLGRTELRSETQLSVDDLRKLKRWDFDDLSLRGGAAGQLPPGP